MQIADNVSSSTQHASATAAGYFHGAAGARRRQSHPRRGSVVGTSCQAANMGEVCTAWLLGCALVVGKAVRHSVAPVLLKPYY